ncbi:MAG: superoxide dismutase, Ni [Acidobacteriota bacterium]
MLHRLLENLDSIAGVPSASAHCDIPCKIYDPSTALIAALSVVRVIDIMEETVEKADGDSLSTRNTLIRCVQRKEEEAERIKHEVRVLWGDYFKAPQLEAHPKVHGLAHEIMMKASACKQEADRANAEALVELVNELAEIFWTTKGVETERKTCPYPPSMPVVYPKL